MCLLKGKSYLNGRLILRVDLPLDDPPPIRISNSLRRQRSYPGHAESVFDFNGNPIQYRFPGDNLC